MRTLSRHPPRETRRISRRPGLAPGVLQHLQAEHEIVAPALEGQVGVGPQEGHPGQRAARARGLGIQLHPVEAGRRHTAPRY
jgi:hypothetical protein